MKPLALALALVLGDAQAVPVRAGDPAPTEGVFLTVEKAAQVSQVHARCLAEKDLLRKDLIKANSESLLTPVAIAVLLGLIGGVLVGVQIGK